MKITLGFSTCPNDTFIFDAMIHRKIDTEGLEFDVLLADVEELNTRAFAGDIDCTKLSYHAYAYVWENYQLLDSGSALGYGNGPLLIGKKNIDPTELNRLTVAIPGKHTTANLLLKIANPSISHIKEFLFSDIEEAIESGSVDAGLIIHENRFTYIAKGLVKLADLGEFWEKHVSAPIPLGGIVVKRTLDDETKRKIERVLKRSVEYAMKNPTEPEEFMQKHAQEMNADVMRKHVALYVNNYTLSLGHEGRVAVETLYKEAYKCKILKQLPADIYVH